MTRIPLLPESEAVAKVEKTHGRIKEILGTEAVPDIFLASGRGPAFLQDFYMNFKRFVFNDGKIGAKTKSVIGLAVAFNANCEPWIEYFRDRGRQLGVTEQQFAEIAAVSATNTMYNAFFKFRGISGNDLFEGMPVGLRAHTFANASLDDVTVELIDIAISDLNACKPCVSGHVAQARKLNISEDAILETAQCAATMSAGIHFLRSAGCC